MCGVLCWATVLWCVYGVLFVLAILLLNLLRAGIFKLCCCCVCVLSLSHGALEWSAVRLWHFLAVLTYCLCYLV